MCFLFPFIVYIHSVAQAQLITGSRHMLSRSHGRCMSGRGVCQQQRGQPAGAALRPVAGQPGGGASRHGGRPPHHRAAAAVAPRLRPRQAHARLPRAHLDPPCVRLLVARYMASREAIAEVSMGTLSGTRSPAPCKSLPRCRQVKTLPGSGFVVRGGCPPWRQHNKHACICFAHAVSCHHSSVGVSLTM